MYNYMQLNDAILFCHTYYPIIAYIKFEHSYRDGQSVDNKVMNAQSKFQNEVINLYRIELQI